MSRSLSLRADDDMERKMQSITGRSYLSQSDVQRLFAAPLDNAYESSKGKKII